MSSLLPVFPNIADCPAFVVILGFPKASRSGPVIYIKKRPGLTFVLTPALFYSQSVSKATVIVIKSM